MNNIEASHFHQSPDSPLKVRMREMARRILRLFGGRSSRDVEYDFAYRNVVGDCLRILDIGGCDSLLPLILAKQGHQVTVYVMKEIYRILTDEGKVIVTFPFNVRERVIPQFERWYTPERVRRLFEGWYVMDVEFWIAERRLFGRWVKWRPATMREAAEAYDRVGVQGVACFCLAKTSREWWER